MFAWLSTRRGGTDLRSPVLVEQHKPYQQFHAWPISRLTQVVMLVRGQNCKLTELQRHVWVIPIQSALLLDCHLHLYQQLLPVKAGPLPPDMTVYEIPKAKGISIHELADYFYARALSSICSILVFIANEHGGLHNIAARLAGWAVLAGTGIHYRQKPQVLIVMPDRTTSPSSRVVEEMIISNILKYHNPLKEMSFAMAQTTWRAFCGKVELVFASSKAPLLPQLQSWIKATNTLPEYCFNKTWLEMLFTCVCREFAENYEKPFCFARAARQDPVPAQLSIQIQSLAREFFELEIYQDLVLIIARALSLDAHRSGLNMRPRAEPGSIAHAILRDWFAEFYWPLLQQTSLANGRVLLEQEFMRLCNEEVPRELGENRLFRLPAIQKNDVCLSCLAGIPLTLSCGHNICERCIIYMNLTSCMFCQEKIQLQAPLKPQGAGVRVLILDGHIEEASMIVAFLKSLRSSLCGDLVDYFDMVICDGIGIFFTIMLFCLGSTVEDCRHQTEKLDRVVVNKDRMTFAKGIQFPRKSLRSGTRIIFPKTRYIFTVPNKALSTALNKVGSRVGSRAIADYRQETERIWPHDPVSVVARCGPHVGELPAQLLASMFYVECEEKPKFYNTLPITFPVVIKCRLSTGSHLFNLTTKFRREKTHISFEDDGMLRYAPFCDDAVWAEVQAGRSFRRVLYIKVRSPTSRVHIQIDGTLTTGAAVISDTAAESLHFNPWETPSVGSFEEQRRLLESSLNRFV